MPVQEFITSIVLEIDGSPVSEEQASAIKYAEVDSSLTLPDMFAVHLMDDNLRWIDDDTFSVGKAVKISIKKTLIGDPTLVNEEIFSGEITAIEPRVIGHGESMLVLRGYDKSHRLHRDRKSTTFLNQTDSGIASTIASSIGLTSQVDSTSVTYDHIYQDNQTDWEFLVSRARRAGRYVYVKEDTLHFVETLSGDAAVATLELGEDLKEFNARLTAGRQVSKVIVRGWDPATQEAIIGEATEARDMPDIQAKDLHSDVRSAFDDPNEIIVDRPVTDQPAAEELAKSIYDEIAQGFVYAECRSVGHPRIQAGVNVELNNIGNRFSGKYIVTHVNHRYEKGVLNTDFTVGARHISTIGELFATMSDTADRRGPMLGKITNAKDPDDIGRVKVKIPSLHNDSETEWARLVAPGAGEERGMQWIPEVNDEVLVLFEHNDINRPLVLGGLWSGTHAVAGAGSVAASSDGGTVNQRIIKSRTGHVIILDDTDGSEKITVESMSGHQFILDDGEKKISVIDQTGSNTLVIDSNSNNMDINVAGDFNVTATGKVTIKSTGDMSLEATGNGKIKSTGGNMDVEASMNAKVKGGMNLALEGGIKGELKAATVSVNGSAMTEVKGGLVKIN